MKTRALLLLLLTLMLVQSNAGSRLLASDSGYYNMLIVGPEGYRTSIGDFIDFKTRQGINARFFSIEFIGGNQSEPNVVRRLHDFVASERESAGIRYLLLVGEYDQVPTKYVYSPSYELGLADFNYKPTDWYYAVPDWQDSQIGLLGGNVPEIAVGRLPVKDRCELQLTLSKIMKVESELQSGIFLTFGDSDAVLDPVLGLTHVYYESNGNLSSVSIAGMLSDGVAYVSSYTHGSTSALWTRAANGDWRTLMTCADVPDITRTYGIQYLVACFTGAIDLGNESLARSLLVSPTGPALVIASSRTEASCNAISSGFWSAFFETGDVGGSFVRAISSYLSDTSKFSLREPKLQMYNSYLTKVVYGDISWIEANPRGVVKNVSSTEESTESAVEGVTDHEISANNSAEALDPSVSISFAAALACCLVVSKRREKTSGTHPRSPGLRKARVIEYSRDRGSSHPDA
jgi:hypothetical protein